MQQHKKQHIVQQLAHLLPGKHLYLINTQGLTVAQLHQLRAACRQQQIHCQVVKNTLLQKALQQLDLGVDCQPLYEQGLRGTSCILLTPEAPSAPAKLVKDFHKKHKTSLPAFKAALIDTALFLGADQLQALTQIKSKETLLAELLLQLQAPLHHLVGALHHSHHQLTGLLTTLSQQ